MGVSYVRKEGTTFDGIFQVDQTPKISNLLDDIEKIEGLSQYIENQGDENLRFVKGKLIKVEFPSSFKGIVFVANYYTLSKNGFQNEL